MSGVTAIGRRRLVRWAALGLAVVGLAAGAWWRWRRAPEPPPGPSEAALAAADPEVAAAVRVARAGVRREPRSVAAWGLLGQVLLANDFDADADACLARAEALDPNEPRWPYLRAYGLSHDRGAAFAAAGRAVAACRRAGKVEPAPYLFLAELYLERSERGQAEALCRAVLDREPDNPRAHLDLGLLALADNDVTECLPHLLRAADSPATRRTAYTQLAAAYQRQGDEAAAAAYARRARAAPADEPLRDPYLEPMQELATGRKARRHQVERLEARGRLKEALALLQRMTADDPADDRALVMLGALLTRTGALAEAEQALRRATTLAPRAVDSTFYLAMALYLQGERLKGIDDGAEAAEKFQAAVEAARQTLALKPDHPQAHAILGLALKRLGRRAEAIASLRAALRCRPEEADVQRELGETLAEDGQTDEAITHLQFACDLAGPNDPRPRQALDRLRAAQKPPSPPRP